MLEDGRSAPSARALWLVVCAALAVWAWHAVPILLGDQALYFRDLATNHFAFRWVGAEALRHGEIPAFVEQLGNGLPYRGNPAALPFYPGNLLYLLMPFWSAFGGHIVLHWLLAGGTMFLLARALRMSPWAAVTAALTYALGGWFAAAMTFYNIVAVAAWWPAVIAAGLRGGRFGIAAGGLACGLALLGGEPITALLGVVPLLLAVAARHGLRRGLWICGAIGVLGVLVALPQIVASSEVIGYSLRGFRGAAEGDNPQFAFQWSRLLELIIPFPFGHPEFRGAHGWWLLGRIPFYFCLHAGICGLGLAVLALRRGDSATTSRPWAMVSLLGLLLAWAGGVRADLFVKLSAGLFRYPEKFLFWFALAMPLIVGFGLDELRRRTMRVGETAAPPRSYRGALYGALLLVAIAPFVLWAAPRLLPIFPQGVGESGGPFKVELALLTQAQMVSLQLAGAGVLLAAFGLLAARGRIGAVVLLQLVSLLPMGTLVMTTPLSAYRDAKSWLTALPADSGVVDVRLMLPPWSMGAYLTATEDFGAIYRIDAMVDSAVKLLPHGIRLPFKRDSEGLGQATYTLLANGTGRLPWSERANWLAVVGADAVVSVEDARTPGLELFDRRRFAGLRLHWLRVRAPLPFAFSPDEVFPDSNPVVTLRRVGNLADPMRTVITDRAVLDHHPGSKVSVVERGNDRIVLQVDGPGGLVVVRRLYHPIWRARSGDRQLRTMVAQLVLMGVEVPPGSHRVVLDVPAGRGVAAACLAVLVALACAVVAWRARRTAVEPEVAGPEVAS